MPGTTPVVDIPAALDLVPLVAPVAGEDSKCPERLLRASPAVWQIELSFLIFGKNVKNTPPTVWQKTWQFLATWEKPASSA